MEGFDELTRQIWICELTYPEGTAHCHLWNKNKKKVKCKNLQYTKLTFLKVKLQRINFSFQFFESLNEKFINYLSTFKCIFAARISTPVSGDW